jgi:hypothetical protein
VKPEVPGMLKVDPPGVLRVSAALRERSDLVAAQRRVCDGIDVMPGDPTMGSGLARFTWMWGSAVTALAHELDLLGVVLGKSAEDVVEVDRAGAR